MDAKHYNALKRVAGIYIKKSIGYMLLCVYVMRFVCCHVCMFFPLLLYAANKITLPRHAYRLKNRLPFGVPRGVYQTMSMHPAYVYGML